jgi:hypothetical protein
MVPVDSKPQKSKYGQVVEDPLDHFKAIPWCAKLLYVLYLSSVETTRGPDSVILREDPSIVSLQIPARNPIPSREFALVNETLNTPDTVRACVVMICKRNPTAESVLDGETGIEPSPELIGLLDLGEGINGYPGTVHGGFFNVMLDEVMGSAVNVQCGGFYLLLLFSYRQCQTQDGFEGVSR